MTSGDIYLAPDMRSFLQRAANDGFLVYYIGDRQDAIDAPAPQAVALVRQLPDIASVLVTWNMSRAIAFKTREGYFDAALRCLNVTWDSDGHLPALDALRALETTPYGDGTPYPRPALCYVPEMSRWPVCFARTWVRQ